MRNTISVYWHALVSVQVKVLSAITQLTEIKILSGISVTGFRKVCSSLSVVQCSGGVLCRNTQHDYKLVTIRSLRSTLPLGQLFSYSEIG